MPRYNKGDILLVNLGTPPKEVVGHEQGKTRPCIVLACFDALGVMLCAPCTTQAQAMRFPGVIKIEASSGGLNQDGYVLLPHIRSISFDRVQSKVLGSISEGDMERLDDRLADILGL